MKTVLLLALGAMLPAADGAAQRPLSARDSALHALDRLAWGGTPGLADSIARTGVMRWIEAQLAVRAPQDPPQASALRLPRLSSRELVARQIEFQRRRQALQGDTARLQDMSPRERREVLARGAAGGDFRQLPGQTRQLALVRMTGSETQLGEVLADFWFNHFNVHQAKGLDRALLPGYVEETIRPGALGRFEDLLVATARSPAMLFYLDNWQSVAPGAVPPELERLERTSPARGATRRPRRAGAMDRARGRNRDSMMTALRSRLPRGLNENYARELLELHTLGVDGGYTQQDVTAVARVLTGWGIDAPSRGGGGEFVFRAWAHDRGPKVVLGRRFEGEGEAEGRELLAMLARPPATLHHVSAKLCARLVADQPPDGCVDAAVAAWRRSDGEIREVVRAIVRSPDFWAPAAVGSKVKTPLEFVVSAVRAVAGEPDTTPRLASQVARLGQPLFLQSAPTGYPEAQDEWVNSGALLARMNFAIDLAAGRIPGVRVNLDRVLGVGVSHAALVALVNESILQGRMTPATRAVIERELTGVSDPREARALAVGLALGGPEFQRQ